MKKGRFRNKKYLILNLKETLPVYTTDEKMPHRYEGRIKFSQDRIQKRMRVNITLHYGFYKFLYRLSDTRLHKETPLNGVPLFIP
jgi:hypothetical protein